VSLPYSSDTQICSNFGCDAGDQFVHCISVSRHKHVVIVRGVQRVTQPL